MTTANAINANGFTFRIVDVIASSRYDIEINYPNMAATCPSLAAIYSVVKMNGRKHYTMDVYQSGRIDVY